MDFSNYVITSGREEEPRKWILVGRILIRGTVLNSQTWFKIFKDFETGVKFASQLVLKRKTKIEYLTDWEKYPFLKKSKYRKFRVDFDDGEWQFKDVHGYVISNASGVDVWYETLRWRWEDNEKGRHWSFVNGEAVKTVVAPYWRYDIVKVITKDEYEEFGDIFVFMRFKNSKFKEIMEKWEKEGKITVDWHSYV